MHKVISSDVVIAHMQCQRKAFLLLRTNEKGIPNEYEGIIQKQEIAARDKYINILKQSIFDIQPYTTNNLKVGSDFLFNATLTINGDEVNGVILKKVKAHSNLGRYSYEPIIIAAVNNISKEQKMILYFAGYILEQIQGRLPVSGTIIDMDGRSHKLRMDNGIKILDTILNSLREWLTATSVESPPVILNKHCSYCQFQGLCKNEAESKDDLSLLKGVTPKIMRRYEKKGVFTVKQLSYLFRPKKRSKRKSKKASTVHSLELQALAIRTKKVYIQELPEISRQPIELFLDIEGIPDKDTYYLIGLLISNSKVCEHHAYWADSDENEEQLWRHFLEKIKEYPEAPIYHYGSYELRAIEKLGNRYKADIQSIKNRLFNINSCIYGKVYFPVTANGLKQIGKFIGASWTLPNSSGLQSLVWRYYWNTTQDIKYKEFLITYNKEDCHALKLLTDELSKIKDQADSLSYIDFAHNPKQHVTDSSAQLHSQFDSILRFAHANYDKNKISFLQNDNREKDASKRIGSKKGHLGYTRVNPKAKTVIHLPCRKKCPKHKGEPLEISKELSKRTIIDLVFGKTGVRKKVIDFVGEKSYCRKCCEYYIPPGIQKLGTNLYGHSFRAWVIYQRLSLRLPYRIITQVSEDLFNEKFSEATIINFIRGFSSYYSDTDGMLIQHILTSPFIHIDETRINIQGVHQYVWVFTDGKHTIFKLSSTREANIVHEILSGYQGTLISDFYGGYDSVQCKQQKCWSHLIRDLNDDLRETPFDSEFETFVLEVRNIILPILESIQGHGSKKRHFNKFKRGVERFYARIIGVKIYKSELVLKYQKRFIRYRESLFTFLEFDNIPWNNNMAERAIRHLAVQRKISFTFHEGLVHQYLLLLGVMQTCRFQDKPLLKFFLSGQKNIDLFKKPKPIRNSQPIKRLEASNTM